MNSRLLFYMAISIALTAGAGWYISRMLDEGINSYLYISLDESSTVPGTTADTKPAQLPAGRMPPPRRRRTRSEAEPGDNGQADDTP
ncbi:hypothetical protein B0G57_10286 [Trinickia symbiotica]|uniref:Uncharacterized protein n=1 Tax=Trinickia symbiotica TaxID=863227 RepID=A0A2N7XAD9_9BURK|nr:hypothetical protein [Trinickia symbiotica]PMS38512.1 hypothetical protein C0Z20_01120 [Trinickia symbiotica]PPK46491.1 hypothetical protein B0G57_10286 [Trinickia symbiotica]